MHSILAARTTFSIGESILETDQLISEAKAAGAKAVAVVDTMSVTALVDFSGRAKDAGIKPILGCRLRFSDDVTWRKTKDAKKAPPETYLTYYVRSEKGLKALFRLLSLANSTERFYFSAKLAFSDLYDALKDLTSEDVAISTGDVGSLVSHPDALEILTEIVGQLSPAAVFANLVPVDLPYYDQVNVRAIELASKLSLPFLVTRPAFYARGKEDARDVMNAVIDNEVFGSMWAKTPLARDQHPISQAELVVAIKDAAKRANTRFQAPGSPFAQGFKNLGPFVDAVTYAWEKHAPSLPLMAPNEFEAVKDECKKGWKERFTKRVFGHQPTQAELRDAYMPRLKYELEVLNKLGFSGYFLLTQEVVQFAKKSGILVGPGRGSVGGSLVAYLMGITDCDPIRFQLLFERFINPDRIDLPDADLDFMGSRRHEVIDYLIGKFGKNRVAGVSNFGTLAAASAIRDVGRVTGLREQDYACSKLTPKKHGANVPLAECAALVPEIEKFSTAHPDQWAWAMDLEGKTRNLSQHAAGIVVAGIDLVERAVVENRGKGAVVCWDKRIVEEQGLIKLDILGLETLDLIQLAMDYIRERHGKRIKLDQMELDDPKVLENFANGRTIGIFQFEGGGMRRLLKEIAKSGSFDFEDVVAAVALYRPGPMETGMMDSYFLRKQGNEDVEYDHPLMEPILKATFGVMVYQEQIMQISRVIAGYSAPEADNLRKIMGKKLPEKMKKERSKFVDGVVATTGQSPEWAGALFDKIEGFAGYGFNRSHSVEYSLISWQAMWLKTYFPVEFTAAALTLMKPEKLPAILKDAQAMGIELTMPDANNSTARFEILTDTALSIPFSRVKGLSDKVSDDIVAARQNGGRFTSKADFEARVTRRIVNVAKVDILDRIGAFSRIEPGQKASDDPTRMRDQIELIPNLVTGTVPVDRDMHADRATLGAINNIVNEYRQAFGPASEDADGMPVKPYCGRQMQGMIIFDAPSAQEERAGQFVFGDSYQWERVAESLGHAGLSGAHFYVTGLVKCPKGKREIAQSEIDRYLPYLKREIQTLEPPFIILMGSKVIRAFYPDFKGRASEQAGKIDYNKELDANIILGFSPGEIYHEPERQELLNNVFDAVAGLINV